VYIDLDSQEYTRLSPLQLKARILDIIDEAAWNKPSTLIFDNLDAICPPEDEVKHRITSRPIILIVTPASTLATDTPESCPPNFITGSNERTRVAQYSCEWHPSDRHGELCRITASAVHAKARFWASGRSLTVQ
jgi:hypothetical protein